jgi:hypothetical protein
MFSIKARSYPRKGVHEMCYTWVGFSLTHKHWTRLKRSARDKHSSILGILALKFIPKPLVEYLWVRPGAYL